MIRLSACCAAEATHAPRHRAAVHPASAVSARRKSRSAAPCEAVMASSEFRTITQNDLVIVQQVNDPLSLEKQREVRKVLRQVEAK